MLKASKIQKSFQNEGVSTPVLRGIDVEIEQGEFVCIMGKSGSGKSTFLNILSSLDKADQGEVIFEQRDIATLDDEASAKLRRESFGFVFQSPKMVKNLNILDNIVLPSTEYKSNKNHVISRALSLMKEIGIEEIAHKKITQVSGGQLQRAGICRALINNPKIIFADEPTGALDSKSTGEVLELFSKFHKEGKTIIMVTHDVNVASKAQRVLIMKDGSICRDLNLEKEDVQTLIDFIK